MELRIKLLMVADMLLLNAKEAVQADIMKLIAIDNVSLSLATANKLQV
jgi:hypothetical protein